MPVVSLFMYTDQISNFSNDYVSLLSALRTFGKQFRDDIIVYNSHYSTFFIVHVLSQTICRMGLYAEMIYTVIITVFL